MAELQELLGRLAGASRQLEDTHSLEEFQRQADEVCTACELTLQQLASARAVLRATTPEAWQALADSDVALPDVLKCAAAAQSAAWQGVALGTAAAGEDGGGGRCATPQHDPRSCLARMARARAASPARPAHALAGRSMR